MQKVKGIKVLIFLVAVLPWVSCSLSFKSSFIEADLKTFYVDNFKSTALNAPATINQTFAEALKDKISRESSLKYTDLEPNLEFGGTIQSFVVTSVAPKPGETTSFNRLTIYVSVDYTNHLDTKDQWTKTFSFFADFPSDQNLLPVQDDLIDIIFKQILEDIFNQAFNNW